ncbi:hypothetical protein D9M68_857620 [compost metagenome]
MSPQSYKAISMCRPWPVRWRSNRAASTAWAAYIPVNMSTAATPNFSSGCPGSPLRAISPASPWITRS